MSTLSQRIRTSSASHSKAVKPSLESYVGKDSKEQKSESQLVHDVQLEAIQQAKLFDAQIHKMKVCSAMGM